MTEATPKAGLEDVVAASSAICYLDGERGVLAYHGYDIHDLARGATFEEVCYLLWHGRLPNRVRAGRPAVAAGRRAAVVRGHRPPDEKLPPSGGMDMLRTLTSALGQLDPDDGDGSQPANAPPGRAADGAAVQPRGGLRPAPGRRRPDPARSRRSGTPRTSCTCSRAVAPSAGDPRLRCRPDAARRSRAERLHVRGAGRRGDAVPTCTRRSSSAIGALKGPLHGGANAEVMRMLIEIGKDAPPERVDEAVRGEAGAEGEDPRVRPSRVPRPKIRARRTSGACRASSANVPGTAAVVRDVAADRAARQGGEEAQRERGLLLGVDVLHAGDPDRPVHADLRRQPRVRLDGARASSSTRTTA